MRCRSSGGQPIDPSRQHRLDRERNLDRLDRLRQRVPSSLSRQHAGLHEHPDGLLQEERVALSSEEPLEGNQLGIVAEQCAEQLADALDRQRVQTHLAVVALAAPGVLILRTIVHEQQDPRRRHAVDEAVEHGLRLGVDPVEVLDDQTHGLRHARGEEHLPDCVVRSFPTLHRIRLVERIVERQDSQQVQDGRHEPTEDQRRPARPSRLALSPPMGYRHPGCDRSS